MSLSRKTLHLTLEEIVSFSTNINAKVSVYEKFLELYEQFFFEKIKTFLPTMRFGDDIRFLLREYNSNFFTDELPLGMNDVGYIENTYKNIVKVNFFKFIRLNSYFKTNTALQFDRILFFKTILGLKPTCLYKLTF